MSIDRRDNVDEGIYSRLDEGVEEGSGQIMLLTGLRASEVDELHGKNILVIGRDVIEYLMGLNPYDAERYGYSEGLRIRKILGLDNKEDITLGLRLESYNEFLRDSIEFKMFLRGLKQALG